MKETRDPNKMNHSNLSKQSHHWIKRICLLLLVSPLILWGVLSLWYGSWPKPICISLVIIYGSACVAVFIMASVKRLLPLLLLVFLIPLIAFSLMAPSHDRNWQPDVAKMPYAEFEGDKIVIHNIRHNEYISETDFDVRYETRSYQLSELRSVDLLMTDWGLGFIAHTMISFGFDNDRYLCLSIETRKEEGEEYSALKGFFRQFELIYILADERDLVRLRTNFRKGEDVYLYRYRISSLEHTRQTLVEFLNRINDLHDTPEWYNAMTENCMTSAFKIARKDAAAGRGKLHWSLILNGYAPDNAYRNGVLDQTMPFDQLKQISRINDRALAAGNSADYSIKIRNGIPGMNYMPPEGE